MRVASEHTAGDDSDRVDRELALLLARLRQREVRALDQLYGCTVDRMYALACKVAGDPRDAEEVVADVYQYAWEHADQFDAARGGVLAWLPIGGVGASRRSISHRCIQNTVSMRIRVVKTIKTYRTWRHSSTAIGCAWRWARSAPTSGD